MPVRIESNNNDSQYKRIQQNHGNIDGGIKNTHNVTDLRIKTIRTKGCCNRSVIFINGTMLCRMRVAANRGAEN